METPGSSYDPFQIFEVDHQECHLLTIRVLRGTDITKGWFGDMWDTPDPYIQLFLPTAPVPTKRTKSIDNDPNPEWNEVLSYYLDPKLKHLLQVRLMDANYTYDETINIVEYDLGQLQLERLTPHTFEFGKGSEVDVEFFLTAHDDPDLRYSLCLCNKEKEFMRTRRQHVMTAMKDILEGDAPKNSRELPVIGILGSGGGFRALTGMAGAMSALWDTRIIDMSMYVAGLSGSAWYLSHLFSNPEFPEKSPGELKEELRSNITASFTKYLFQPNSMYKYISRISQKKKRGQPVSFTDFFGCVIGEVLLKNRYECHLSDQQKKVISGSAPMPIYNCLNVKTDVSAKVFHEWVEFSPFEIGMPKYGTFMNPVLFGSRYYLGRMVKQYQEAPLHYLQGVWGSAFTILLSRLFHEEDITSHTCMKALEDREAFENLLGAELETHDEIPDMDVDSEEEDEEEDKEEGEAKEEETEEEDAKEEGASKEGSGKGNGLWESVFTKLAARYTLLSSRKGRAGFIHNFLHGVSLTKIYPVSPFTEHSEKGEQVDGEVPFQGIFDAAPTTSKTLCLVDGGLSFNSPFPPLLRPQRGVDILLSFDFSARHCDNELPFQELKLAEKWARLNNIPFPVIDEGVYDKHGMQEVYVFKDPDQSDCPVIIHFTLANLSFRDFIRPGVPRDTDEEKEASNFTIFEDEGDPYSTFNFTYTETSFDRLFDLMEYNTLNNMDVILDEIKNCILKKRKKKPSERISLKRMSNLIKTKDAEMQKLKKYLETVDEQDSDDNEDY